MLASYLIYIDAGNFSLTTVSCIVMIITDKDIMPKLYELQMTDR